MVNKEEWLWSPTDFFVICFFSVFKPRPHVPVLSLKTEIFFSGFAYRPHVFGGGKRSPKTHLFKNAIQSGDFWIRKRRLPIRWCHISFITSTTHALWRMLSYFHCLAFSFGRVIRIRYVWMRIFFLKTEEKDLRFQKYPDACGWGLSACLHESGGPRVGEVTCGKLPHLTCKRDHIKMRDYMDRRVTPPKWVTSPTSGPPPPCKRALRLDRA